MKQENEMLDALFKHATEGIVVVGKDAGIVMVNPKAEQLFGYQKDELIGSKIEVLIPKRFGSTHTQHRDKYIGQPHARSMGIGLDLFAIKKDGTEFPVEVSLSSFNTSEGAFFMSFIIDVTERKKQEDEIKLLNAQLEQRVEERTEELAQAINRLAESKQEVIRSLEAEKVLNELKSRFITTASHEFRTPLATILSSVNLIGEYTDEKDQDKRQKHIKRIRSSVHNLTQILNDFLSLSKLEEGVVRNQPENFELDDYLNDIIEEMKSTLKAGQEFKHFKSEISCEVFMDKHLLKNVLFNLLSNASKYSDEGKEIHVLNQSGSGRITLTVKDHGIGIPEEDQPMLFKRFFRATNSGNVQGTGLGLNIVQKYIELMNGEIDYKSKLNEGTTFTLSFPAQ